ncbi:MAG: hypothetical protein FRX48_02107 [Lasallia pustulata]|uniref:Uncharacterized protein n=1 Tax=Lasallia pustulata TaxID=136370 RepID=A0A5M8PXG0_9LECA|nr:MAG: hypothetical protein FRX48_02107 [Lasallia pustulata]
MVGKAAAQLVRKPLATKGRKRKRAAEVVTGMRVPVRHTLRQPQQYTLRQPQQ